MENIFTGIKDRVVEVAESQSISKEAFFKSIDMTSANFRGKAKKTPLNSNTIVNIITKYPEVDLHWLLFGSTKTTISYKDIIVEESKGHIEYKPVCKKCDEKEKTVKALENKIIELKTDKEDLKVLLGLRNN